jgi:hypothetical protein
MRAFFDLVARHGCHPISLATYLSSVSNAADVALRAQGIVKPAPLARTYPCGDDEPGCSRVVRGFDDDDAGLDESEPNAPRTYVAVCSRSPQACPFVEVATDALARVAIQHAALVAVVTRALAITPPRRTHRAAARPDDSEPLLLGETSQDATPRDAYLLLEPRPDLELRLAARSRDPRRAIYFVPTSHGIDLDLFARHAKDAPIELARLDDRLFARGNAIVAAPHLRIVADTPDESPDLFPTDARPLPRFKHWNELRICMVDGETILLTAAGINSRRTYVDMGMADGGNRKPLKHWKIFIAMLEGEGTFKWHVFGTYEKVAKQVSLLRGSLRRALGVESDPFEAIDDGQGWRPRFIAKREPPRPKLRGR